MNKIEVNNSTETTYFQKNNLLNIAKDGKIQLDKDKEAVYSYFIEYVNPRTVFFHTLKEKLNFLTNNNYIKKDLLDLYSETFVKKLFKRIYDKKFRFNTFMGAYKFYSQYALKTKDGEWILERYEDRLAFNALVMAEGDEQLALDLADELINRRYQPATPTFLNIGKTNGGEYVSCFLLSIEDSMNSIGRVINSSLQLSKRGGGVALDLSNIRGSGDAIRDVIGLSDGIVPVMKLLEDAFSYANQGGARDGAGAVYLNIFHQDVIDFLSVRKENADEKVRIKTLSLGLTVPDKYYELVKKNKPMYLFSSRDVEREYGVGLSYIDITKEYDNMVANPNIKKSKINARELETEISNLQNESGYPYILNIDHANSANAIDGRIIMSNLCTEITQVHKPSKINDRQEYDVLGDDVSCNLGSTNVANLMESKDFGKSVITMFKSLDYVARISDLDCVPSIKNGNDKYHAVGLGMMNLHGALAKNEIMYGSDESIEYTDAYTMLLNYWTLKASNIIAQERSFKFHEFELSKYADGKYFDEYLPKIKRYKNGVYTFESKKVEKLFGKHFIPTIEDWRELDKSIRQHGLANSYRLAIAPTGSISYVNEATASIHPIISRIEERLEGKRGKVYYPAPYLSEKTIPYYVSAYDIDQRKLIDLYATASIHIDQAISMTLFTRSVFEKGMYEWKNGTANETEKTTRDLSILRNYAWKKGVKSIYYIRTFTEDNQEVGVNQCESCSI